MTLQQCEPFVRQAITTTLSTQNREDVFYSLRTSDCRLFYILGGEGCINIEGTAHRLTPGCAILFSAGTEYVWQIDEGRPLHFIVINFDYTHRHAHIRKSFHPIHSDIFSDSDILERVSFEDAAALNQPVVIESASMLESRFRLLTTEFFLGGNHCDELLSSVLKSLILSILRMIEEKGTYSGKSQTLIREIIRYIQNNYASPITNETLARHFHYNPSYISRVFREHTGASLHTFLVNYRMNMAMDILRSTSTPISDIVYQVGFCDLPHFSKTFKRLVGQTPSEYRSFNK
ncbi:MAG: helix-turn-helix transcriptional regulator [Clostridia bacterium]|nr:helix-turn-helix transcriptional regulator [Clostridia bacterium]